MCGRYAATANPDELVLEFQVEADRTAEPSRSILVNPQHPPAGTPDPDFGPTKQGPVVLTRHPRRPASSPEAATAAPAPVRQLRLLTWGLVPSWSKDVKGAARMINARAETLRQRPAYVKAFAARRCLVPAAGWYEWQLTEQSGPSGRPRKQPHLIRRVDGSTVAMAGIYEFWRDPTVAPEDPLAWLSTYAVVTTAAEPALSHIHDRQPLVLEASHWQRWLDPDAGIPDVIDLVQPRTEDSGRFEALPVLAPGAPW